MRGHHGLVMMDEAYTNGTSKGLVDAAFKLIPKNYATFLIWRIENMNVVALPKELYGTFYDTDAYLIFAASQYGQPSGMESVSRELKSGTLEYHVHFWLGANASGDRSGVAAYKSVELDGLFGGMTIQHRETQGSESPRFLSYFKTDGIRILKGGASSCLQPASIEFQPRLYCVKGRRVSLLVQQDRVSWDRFNSSDVFLLHTSKTIFMWIGRAANPVEKLHSTKVALQLQAEFKTPNLLFVDDGYEQSMVETEKQLFQKFLPLDKRQIMPLENGSEDDGKVHRIKIRLYKCSDVNGKYRVMEIKSGPLTHSDLDSDDVFILDHGIHGIWVWVGRRASDKERTEAMRNARGFVKKKKYPGNTPVTRVVDGAEPIEFKALFVTWKNREDSKINGKTISMNKIAQITLVKFNAEMMLERKALAAETQLIDDGKGGAQIWMVNQMGAVLIPKERHGVLFSGDCYVILYSYNLPYEQKHIVYYWMGSDASQKDKLSTTIMAHQKDEDLQGMTIQARVYQGHEPAHLLQLFNGKLIVFQGKSTDFDPSGRIGKIPSKCLLQVQGSTTYNTKATQVHCKASSLNTNYCFILRNGEDRFIWCGNCSTGDQREMAKSIVGSKDFELILEGKETKDFWSVIGGQVPYFVTNNNNLTDNGNNSKPVRLFNCSSSSGSFNATEIFHFSQNDLTPEDVMLLDANHTLYLWIGDMSTKEEKNSSLQTAANYLKTDPAGKSHHIPIIQIKQGSEPPTFTGFFGTWDEDFLRDYKPFGQLRDELERSSNKVTVAKNGCNPSTKSSPFDQFVKYPISILKEPNDKLPAKVDPQHKEIHLTHDDFVMLFNISYSDFEQLPRWKQQEMKKKVGLF